MKRESRWKLALMWVGHFATIPGYYHWSRRRWFLSVTWLPLDWNIGAGFRFGTGAMTVALFLRLGPFWLDAGLRRGDTIRQPR